MTTTSRSFWWVNHKQTFKHEVEGGYIWSPKRNKNGGFNQFYENMSLVSPGDVVISYADTKIKAIGIATRSARNHVKPSFGERIGENWSAHEGWFIPVEWTILSEAIRPKDHIDRIAPILPNKYSPLQPNGDGNQVCYLARVSDELGDLVLSLAGHATPAIPGRVDDISSLAQEDEIERGILSSASQATVKDQLIRARQGQGLFRQRVMAIEASCRVTGITDERFLIASHIKPWRESSNEERLDGNNGLMLSPHVDRLFDKGWISFSDGGELLVCSDAAPILKAWNIALQVEQKEFNMHQRYYLSYHRQFILKTS